MKNSNKRKITRRSFLKLVGAGSLAAAAASVGCSGPEGKSSSSKKKRGTMTYRITPTTHDKVSLLGYGMMRLPATDGNPAGKKNDSPIDQKQVNRLVDYAMENGVNYFDTSPAYCKGESEASTGIALHRHPRESYFVATKLSNFSPEKWSRAASMQMYRNSFKNLQVDCIDYYLLHGIGMPAEKDGEKVSGMDALKARYFDNGMLDFLVEERKAGRIRNLGFSYHGDIAAFDYLLSMHDKYKWDFVQIQLNYVDWKHAKEVRERNTNAEYLYSELEKRGIPAIIMEPLLGGRLATLPDHVVETLKQRVPDSSVASWAFRYAGNFPNVLTVLSGMTYMEHLEENLDTYSPLVNLTNDDLEFLEYVAKLILKYPTIPCNDCKYCMPCPYGIDIPAIFVHYNKCVNEGNVPSSAQDPEYARERKAFLVGYDRSVPRLRQASHCIGCNQCVSHCPQTIEIPSELHRIDGFVESLKQGTLI